MPERVTTAGAERLTVISNSAGLIGRLPQNSTGPRLDPRPEILEFDRPWGHQEQFTCNEKTTAKILTVYPAGRLSLQRHQHRDELWVVLDHDIVAVLNGVEHTFSVGSRVWIPRGTVHRLVNPGTETIRVLELSFGEFDEDDIERLEDDYQRVQ